jgi:hypothetical protein
MLNEVLRGKIKLCCGPNGRAGSYEFQSMHQSARYKKMYSRTDDNSAIFE